MGHKPDDDGLELHDFFLPFKRDAECFLGFLALIGFHSLPSVSVRWVLR